MNVLCHGLFSNLYHARQLVKLRIYGVRFSKQIEQLLLELEILIQDIGPNLIELLGGHFLYDDADHSVNRNL